jgi:hypothetical protein
LPIRAELLYDAGLADNELKSAEEKKLRALCVEKASVGEFDLPANLDKCVDEAGSLLQTPTSAEVLSLPAGSTELIQEDLTLAQTLLLEKQRQLSADDQAFHSQETRLRSEQSSSLRQAVELLDNDPKTRDKHKGMGTEGDHMLLSLLKADKSGAAHRAAEAILLQRHLSITTTEHGTRARLLDNIIRSDHGAAQASALRLLQDQSGHITEREKDHMLFQLVRTAAPNPKLREHVQKISTQASTRGEIAQAVLSVMAARAHPQELWRKQHHSKLVETATSADVTTNKYP